MAIQTAFLFPGQGSQAVGMTDGFTDEAGCAVFERARAVLGVDIPRICATSSPTSLARTEVAQPAIFAVSVAAAAALAARGVEPDVVAGHSLGEIAAAVVAGAIELDDGFALVETRAHAMARAARARPGGMAAILGLSPDEVAETCAAAGGTATLANINTHEQVVVSGTDHALAVVAAEAKRRGARRVIRLEVSVAAHSPMMAPAEQAVRAAAQAVAWRRTRTLFVSAASGRAEPDPDFPSLLADAVTAPVRWTDAMASVLATGATTLIEVGPGHVLAGLARRLAPGCEVFTVGSDEEAARVAARIQEVHHARV